MEGKKNNFLCFKVQQQCRMTCNLVVDGNVIKRLSAEIVAVLRTHEGAAVVGGMKSSNLRQRSRFPSVPRQIQRLFCSHASRRPLRRLMWRLLSGVGRGERVISSCRAAAARDVCV